MKTLTIKRSEWRHGLLPNSVHGGALYDSAQKSCCLGHLIAQEVDIPRNKLTNSTPHAFTYFNERFGAKLIKVGLIIDMGPIDDKHMFDNTDWTNVAMSINDSVIGTVLEKEIKLIDHFEQLNIKLEFVD